MAATDSGRFPGAEGSEWGSTPGEAAPDRRPARHRDFKRLMRDTAYQRLGREKNRMSEALETAAEAVRSVAQQLRDDGHPAVAEYVTRAGDGIERWASGLRHQDPELVLRRLEGFARRRPAVFLGGAFAAGLLAARVLKSSPRRRVPPLAGGVL